MPTISQELIQQFINEEYNGQPKVKFKSAITAIWYNYVLDMILETEADAEIPLIFSRKDITTEITQILCQNNPLLETKIASTMKNALTNAMNSPNSFIAKNTNMSSFSIVFDAEVDFSNKKYDIVRNKMCEARNKTIAWQNKPLRPVRLDDSVLGKKKAVDKATTDLHVSSSQNPPHRNLPPKASSLDINGQSSNQAPEITVGSQNYYVSKKVESKKQKKNSSGEMNTYNNNQLFFAAHKSVVNSFINLSAFDFMQSQGSTVPPDANNPPPSEPQEGEDDFCELFAPKT